MRELVAFCIGEIWRGTSLMTFWGLGSVNK